jgi:hypothetical protein
MQLAERVGHATPVGLGLGRSAFQVGHHDQTVGEPPSVRRRDRHRHGQTFVVEVSEELDLPREIRVAPGAETTDRELPAHAHAPHVVGDSARERLDASDVVTPLLERFPSHGSILAELRISFEGEARSRSARRASVTNSIAAPGIV